MALIAPHLPPCHVDRPGLHVHRRRRQFKYSNICRAGCRCAGINLIGRIFLVSIVGLLLCVATGAESADFTVDVSDDNVRNILSASVDVDSVENSVSVENAAGSDNLEAPDAQELARKQFFDDRSNALRHCTDSVGSSAGIDLQGHCRCRPDQEMVDGQCKLTEMAEMLDEEWPYKQMPPCFSVLDCTQGMFSYMKSDLHTLHACREKAAQLKGDIDVLHELKVRSERDHKNRASEIADQSVNLVAMNGRLLNELESLQAISHGLESTQTDVRKMITQNSELKRRSAEATKKLEKLRVELQELENEGQKNSDRCEDNIQILKESYKEHKLPLPNLPYV